jgi:hypothetical protein
MLLLVVSSQARCSSALGLRIQLLQFSLERGSTSPKNTLIENARPGDRASAAGVKARVCLLSLNLLVRSDGPGVATRRVMPLHRAITYLHWRHNPARAERRRLRNDLHPSAPRERCYAALRSSLGTVVACPTRRVCRQCSWYRCGPCSRASNRALPPGWPVTASHSGAFKRSRKAVWSKKLRTPRAGA